MEMEPRIRKGGLCINPLFWFKGTSFKTTFEKRRCSNEEEQHRQESEAESTIFSSRASSLTGKFVHIESPSRWSETVGRALAILLEEAGYSEDRRRDAALFFDFTIAPNLGGVRSAFEDAPAWKSFMTDDHTPVELSWDWGDGTSAANKAPPQIRYSVEPINPSAGTPFDLLNGFAAERFHSILSKQYDLDQTWYRHFWELFRNRAQQDLSDDQQGHASEVFYAFDLKHDERMNDTPKVYFFPSFRAKQMQQTPLEAMSDALDTTPRCDSVAMGFPTFKDFVQNSLTTETPAQLEMLAIDMIEPAKSRIKIYFRVLKTSFDSVIWAMTLGGRLKLTEHRRQGLERLRLLWKCLFVAVNEDSEELANTDHRGCRAATTTTTTTTTDHHHRTAGLLYNVELNPRDAEPTVKIYIPVRHYAQSDASVMSGLEGFLVHENRDRWLPAYRKAMGRIL